MDQLTGQFYDTAAAAICADYEAANPAALHAWLRRQIPPGAQVLDLGCGSGRDAAFMMRLGVTVMAVDASAAMLEQARLAHPELSACLHQAALPLPPEHPLLTRRFTVITCLAMLMHVPDEALFDLVFQIKQMLTADGLLLLSVSTGRQCLSDNRDAAGRLYLEETIAKKLRKFLKHEHRIHPFSDFDF